MLAAIGIAAFGLLASQKSLAAPFDYDPTQPFDKTCQPIPRQDVRLEGCSFAGPRGGRVHFLIVSPRTAKKHSAGVIFQHGGGQSMTNYLSEAFILARAGVVSIIPDAPARGDGKNSELNTMKLEAARDHIAEMVVTQRRVLDLLLQQPGIDPTRIAFVGHSYGGTAGGVLAGIEPRIATFILIGAVPSHARHIEENGSGYWQQMRSRLSASEMEKTLALLRAIDPVHYLPAARAPMLIQCARLDSDDNVRACPEVHKLAGGHKQLLWYDDEHSFPSLEAVRDRLYWLQQHLKLQPLEPVIRSFLRPR